MKSQYALIIAAAATLPASAQISREITVDREVVPVERPASRISLVPATVQPKFPKATVKFSDRAVATDITPLHTQLEPATTDEADSMVINQRGYVDLGYFPTYNLGLSAGYQFVNNRATQAGAWLQFDGHSYTSRDRWDNEDLDNKRNTFTIGGDLNRAFSATSGLQASLAYTYDANKWENPMMDGGKINKFPTLDAHRFNLNVGYHGRAGHWGYRATFDGGVNAVSALQLTQPKTSNTEWLYGINGEVSYATGRDSRAGLRVDWQMRTERFADYGASNETMGMVNLNPYWLSPILEGMNLELGLNADFSINSGTTANFSPECAISWAPRGSMSAFAVEVKATGGLYANTLQSLLDYTPYIFPSYDAFDNTYHALGNSHVPYDIAANITIGPFSGAYLGLSGEYAKANNWMMPSRYEAINLWTPTDIKGWLIGAKAGYRFRDLGEISVAYQHASGDGDDAFYRWRDRARHALDARLMVRPIKPLEVSVGFESRWGRKLTRYSYYQNDGGFIHTGDESLGTKRNLWVGASYRLTPQLTIFARGENLTNSYYQLLLDIPAQGVTGLVGAQYTF